MQTRHSGRPAQTAAWGGEPSLAEAPASGELAPIPSYAELEATRGRHTFLGAPRPNFARVGSVVGSRRRPVGDLWR